MKVEITKNINWIISIVLILFEIITLFFIFLFCYVFFTDLRYSEYFSSGNLFTIIILFFLALYVLDIIIWKIRGYEILEMDNRELIVKKRGKLFPTRNIISIIEIEKIQVKDYPKKFSNLFLRLVGTKGGKINIRYLGRDIYAGQGLTSEKAYALEKKMNNLLLTYKESVESKL